MYQRAKLKTTVLLEDDFSTMNHVLEAVKSEMVEIIKEDYSVGLADADFNALYKRKARIQDALRNCVHGIDSAKVIVIELIRGFISQNVHPNRIGELLGVSDGMIPSDHVMFEILMYRYKKQYGKQALGELLTKYDLTRERKASGAENATDTAYFATIEDLHDMYEQEDIRLSPDEQVDILAVLIYQLYKGFGILDTLREMDINGFNCGTSGSIMSNVSSHREGNLKATNSVWLYFQGKYIHLRFMSFGSEDELKRIIQLLVRYNNPGPLTAKRGYLVNTMYDKSRVLALRPPASEYWAIFVRKFTISDPSPKALIIKPHTKRGDLPIKAIEYLLRGQTTCAVTGRQGSGKTTLMSSIIRYVDPRYTLRILEMAPELYLREIYPSRNILSVQETETVSAAELQDALKKSDAAVSIVGEVATDVIAARMIQMGMTASLFTIFSHHANTPKDLVLTLRNSLVNAGGFSNMTTAERQVTEVVKMDIHLDYTPEGDRFIERISEIIPLSENVPYAEYDPMNPVDSMNAITRDYYTRQTDRVSFITKDILYYDKKTKTYHAKERISVALENKIRGNLGELRHDFDKFTFAEWGRRTDLAEGEVDEVALAMLDYYSETSVPTITTSNEGIEETAITTGLVISDIPEDEQVIAVQNIIKSEIKETIKEEEQVVVEGENDFDDAEDTKLFFDFFDGGVNV
jgi:pilus assembly protein CpaF